ncbi:hypothetical protein SVIOM342S_08472 [Streptomyces violaceorubidus]
MERFDGVDEALATALKHEKGGVRAGGGRRPGRRMGLPAPGRGVLAALGAAGALIGIGRRLSEYR